MSCAESIGTSRDPEPTIRQHDRCWLSRACARRAAAARVPRKSMPRVCLSPDWGRDRGEEFGEDRAAHGESRLPTGKRTPVTSTAGLRCLSPADGGAKRALLQRPGPPADRRCKGLLTVRNVGRCCRVSGGPPGPSRSIHEEQSISGSPGDARSTRSEAEGRHGCIGPHGPDHDLAQESVRARSGQACCATSPERYAQR
jgi:hypothetical protein